MVIDVAVRGRSSLLLLLRYVEEGEEKDREGLVKESK